MEMLRPRHKKVALMGEDNGWYVMVQVWENKDSIASVATPKWIPLSGMMPHPESAVMDALHKEETR